MEPGGPTSDRIAVVFLQPQCDMTCLFCATEDHFQPLTSENGRRLLVALQAQDVRRVILGGGEPFAWKPGPLTLAKFAKSLGLHVQIGTNGIALPEGFADCPWVDRYILPLESAESEAHDWLRLHRGGHHRIILDRMKTLALAGKPVTVSTVVTRRNIASLPELGRYLARYQEENGNLHAWHLYHLLHVGRGGAVHGPRLSVEKAEYHAACNAVRKQQPSLQILKRPDMLHSSTVGFFWHEKGAFRSLSPYPTILPE